MLFVYQKRIREDIDILRKNNVKPKWLEFVKVLGGFVFKITIGIFVISFFAGFLAWLRKGWDVIKARPNILKKSWYKLVLYINMVKDNFKTK